MLASLLQLERPNCLVRYIDKDATPSYWLYFYLTFFKLITMHDLTYLQALEEVVDLLLDIFNKNMVWVVMAMFCILFFVGILLVFNFLHSPEKMALVFGGTFLSLVTVVTGLQKLWHEKTIIDLLLTLLPDITPAESIKLIEILSYSKKK
jgi:cell division protein FtsW (lipid II flippase)